MNSTDDTQNIPASVSWIRPRGFLAGFANQHSPRSSAWTQSKTDLMQQLLIIALVGALSGALTTRGGSESAAIAERSAVESYAKHCASCHGRDGRSKTTKGKRNHARNLADPEWQARVSDERIFNSVMNGKGKMPEYSKKLSEQEIDALVTYVRSFR